MKTKLLKKVRKRFQIVKVTKCGKNDFKYLDVSKLKVPFYVIIDNNASVFYFREATQNYERAFQELILIVKREYKDKATFRLETEKVYFKDGK